jgi:hypothetical protein
MFSAYGAAIDKLNADPAFQAWQVKRAKAGLASFVRSNLAVEITGGKSRHRSTRWRLFAGFGR